MAIPSYLQITRWHFFVVCMSERRSSCFKLNRYSEQIFGVLLKGFVGYVKSSIQIMRIVVFKRETQKCDCNPSNNKN